MNATEYIANALKTEAAPRLPSEAMEPATFRLIHAVLGICSEVPEVERVIDDREKLKEELGDLFWYVAIAYDVTHGEAAHTVFARDVVDGATMTVASDDFPVSSYTGGMADIAKRLFAYGTLRNTPATTAALASALRCLVIAMMACAGYQGLSDNEILDHNIKKLRKRHGASFNSHAAINHRGANPEAPNAASPANFTVIHLIGPTNAGKSTLVADVVQWPGKVHAVEVGKTLRAKYPPSHFEGHCNPLRTAEEAWALYVEGVQAGIAAGARLIIVDGQPRDLQQLDDLAKLPWFGNSIFLNLYCSKAKRIERANRRDLQHPDRLALSVARLTSDYEPNYEVLCRLLIRAPGRVYTVDTEVVMAASAQLDEILRARTRNTGG